MAEPSSRSRQSSQPEDARVRFPIKSDPQPSRKHKRLSNRLDPPRPQRRALPPFQRRPRRPPQLLRRSPGVGRPIRNPRCPGDRRRARSMAPGTPVHRRHQNMTQAMETIENLRRGVHDWLLDHELAQDTRFHTREEWRARKEDYPTDAALVLVFEGELFRVMNSHHEESTKLQADLEQFVRHLGYFFELATPGAWVSIPFQSVTNQMTFESPPPPSPRRLPAATRNSPAISRSRRGRSVSGLHRRYGRS